jgi:hypothetical protein
VTEPLRVDPQYVIDAQRDEITRLNDNRMYLMACVAQLTDEAARLNADREGSNRSGGG